jgi:hypothetical protein
MPGLLLAWADPVDVLLGLGLTASHGHRKAKRLPRQHPVLPEGGSKAPNLMFTQRVRQGVEGRQVLLLDVDLVADQIPRLRRESVLGGIEGAGWSRGRTALFFLAVSATHA